MVGTSVSHYRILASIGAGGMGRRLSCRRRAPASQVALKFLPAAIAQDEHSRARLLREAQAASALDHPNVATVCDIGEWNGQLFIAMPFYDGETLRQRIERGRSPSTKRARIAGEIAAGLAAAHAAGIVHRDLKPANVMLTHDGQVRIVDFGLAKVVSETQETVGANDARPASTVGTAAYMAPEQATGLDVDARADIWAFGVTFYEMLTGRLPFDGRTRAGLAPRGRRHSRRRRSRGLRPDVPEALEGIVERALEKIRRGGLFPPTRLRPRSAAGGRGRRLARWLRPRAGDRQPNGGRRFAAVALLAAAVPGVVVRPSERADAVGPRAGAACRSISSPEREALRRGIHAWRSRRKR